LISTTRKKAIYALRKQPAKGPFTRPLLFGGCATFCTIVRYCLTNLTMLARVHPLPEFVFFKNPCEPAANG
jgi:hypothetical protein